MKQFILIAAAGLAMSHVTACQTISEEACMAGSWEDVGFKDGERGKSRSRLSDIAEECAKYGATVDRTAYLRGLDLGLRRYCTGDVGADHGFDDGRAGRSPNAECEALGSISYLAAYDDGYAVHLSEEERDRLVDRWKDRRKAYYNVADRLETQEMDAKERRRLEKKLRRLSRQMDDLRIEVRAIERQHDLYRYNFPDV